MRTRVALIDAAIRPCVHRSDVPCAGCEMARRREIFAKDMSEVWAMGEWATRMVRP